MRGHRDLVGIESPPHDFVPDRMTLGPRLPEGWDGDAWTAPDESCYFLRAWNKATASFAIGRGSRYEDARALLLDEIAKGGRPVSVRVQERLVGPSAVANDWRRIRSRNQSPFRSKSPENPIALRFVVG